MPRFLRIVGVDARLRQARAEIAAQYMGISRTVLFSSEQGVLPQVDHAVKIARAYNRSVEGIWPCPASARPSKSADTNREGYG